MNVLTFQGESPGSLVGMYSRVLTCSNPALGNEKPSQILVLLAT
jgi:hypothetical protein